MKNHLKGAMIANDMKNDQGGYTTSTNIRIQGGVWDASKVGDKTGSESFRFIHANNAPLQKILLANGQQSRRLISTARPEAKHLLTR